MQKEFTTVHYNCSICGSYLDSFFRCPNNCHDSNYLPYYSANYTYKCPSCYGEFNYPTFIPAPGSYTAGTYKCPFCNYIMEGM